MTALAGTPPEQVPVRVECTRQPDGQWAIRLIRFDSPHRRAAAPASGPVAREPAAP
jgi:hypothetical protein